MGCLTTGTGLDGLGGRIGGFKVTELLGGSGGGDLITDGLSGVGRGVWTPEKSPTTPQ